MINKVREEVVTYNCNPQITSKNYKVLNDLMNKVQFSRSKLLFLTVLLMTTDAWAQTKSKVVPQQVMQDIYTQIRTPYKYGLIFAPSDNSEKADCPTVFRKGNQWYMSYLIFNGKGYETWLSKSDDLLNWKTQGRIMSFSSDTTDWDANQKAGYMALQDTKWGGSYQLAKYQNKYWMSYFGGNSKGYERGLLSISMAFTKKDPSIVHE